MKQRFILFRRNGTFYCEDTDTHQQLSLRTKDEAEALTLLHAKNESVRQAKQVAKEIVASNGRAIVVRADVEKLEDHERLVSAALDEFGALNILVNNAGIEFREAFLTTTEEQFDHTLGVNLKGVYFLSQQAAQARIRAGKGGKIIKHFQLP